MIAFEIYRNGKKLCTAGAGDAAVLTAILSWSAPKGKRRSNRKRASRGVAHDLNLHVGGLITVPPNASEHVRWLSTSLRVGDQVTMKLIETDSPDKPQRRSVYTEEQAERQEKQYYEKLKKKYEAT